MAEKVGAGATLTMSGLPTWNIESMEWSGVSREVVPTTHLGTTGGDTFLPAATYDPGELSIEFQHDATDAVQADEVMALGVVAATVTFNSVTTTDTYVANAIVTDYSVSMATKELNKGTATLKFSGDIVSTTA